MSVCEYRKHLNMIRVQYRLDSNDRIGRAVREYARRFNAEMSKLSQPYATVVTLTPGDISNMIDLLIKELNLKRMNHD